MIGKSKPLTKGQKVMVGVGSAIALFTVIGAVSPPPDEKASTKLIQNTAQVKGVAATDDEEEAQPKVEEKIVEEAAAIPFTSSTRNDATLTAGSAVITVPGVNGEKIMIYKVTLTDGIETNRVIMGERINRAPTNELRTIGTKPKVVAAAPSPSNCSPNYSGCVPIASDVDCAGGSGDGPAYASGPVQVTGADIYGLDRDGNGIGCE